MAVLDAPGQSDPVEIFEDGLGVLARKLERVGIFIRSDKFVLTFLSVRIK